MRPINGRVSSSAPIAREKAFRYSSATTKDSCHARGDGAISNAEVLSKKANSRSDATVAGRVLPSS